jgi:predicted NBD/HSP70 family sugar kinase
VEKPGPGRPSPLVAPRRDGPVVLAVEMATGSLAVAVVGLGGAILSSTRIDRPRGARSPGREVSAVAQLARGPIAEMRHGESLVAVGVSVPGLVRRKDGFVHLAPNLGWRDIAVPALVSEELQLDIPVFVGNDANLATLAEHTRGAGVGHSDFICLWGEAGLGAGIVASGSQLGGSQGYAGEVGHMTVNPDGVACHCGSRGCWETEVGEEALARHAGESASDGGHAGMEELLVAAEEGVPAAMDAMAVVGRWLGIGIAGLIDIFNPGAIALGALYGRLYPHVRTAILEEVARRAIGTERGLVAIVPVSLGSDAALLGAAEIAFEPTIADPAALPPTGDVRQGSGARASTRQLYD